ncbi:hypothetical protein MTR_7g115030 [Medicago truncatula]|uniref:Uncharacterized protein n=1 Tax=Medicago truncatula TaxID=3880 RepID=G7L1W5_MEDTR|nr:hypothetical protein MTR_7g115030 [Medicago truncatula]
MWVPRCMWCYKRDIIKFLYRTTCMHLSLFFTFQFSSGLFSIDCEITNSQRRITKTRD